MTSSLYILISYLIGSVSTGLIIAILYADTDPRTMGSGNIGATNVGRVTGPALGRITLVGDLGKGFVPVLLAPFVNPSPVYVGLVAIAVFVGHCYSVFLRFKGGKGVATAAGAILALSPLAAIVALLAWAGMTRWTHQASVASIATAVMAPILVLWLTPQYLWVAITLMVGILYHHRSNVVRLFEGEELSTWRSTTPTPPQTVDPRAEE